MLNPGYLWFQQWSISDEPKFTCPVIKMSIQSSLTQLHSPPPSVKLSLFAVFFLITFQSKLGLVQLSHGETVQNRLVELPFLVDDSPTWTRCVLMFKWGLVNCLILIICSWTFKVENLSQSIFLAVPSQTNHQSRIWISLSGSYDMFLALINCLATVTPPPPLQYQKHG